MVLPRDKAGIRELSRELGESAEAEEVEVTRRLFDFSQPGMYRNLHFAEGASKTPPPASLNPKGEFQCGEMGSRW
jgi:hypothetical protein